MMEKDPFRNTARMLPRQRRDWWWAPIWTVVAVATLSGLFAWAMGGQARIVAVLVQTLAALALAWVVAAHRLGQSPSKFLQDGSYRPPRSRRVALLHLVLTLLYNVGIMVAVAAGAIRFGLVDIPYGDATLRWFPLFTGLLVTLLALATGWRLDEERHVIRAWYTRTHGWVLLVWSLAVVGATTYVLATGEVQRGDVVLLGRADLLVLSLLTVLGAATQVFLAVNLPSTLDLGAAIVRLVKQRDRSLEAGTPPFVYALIITGVSVAVLAFLFVQLDIIQRLGNFQNERVALLLLLIPFALLAFFTSSVVQVYRESRRGLYARRMPTKLRNNLLIYGTSSLLGVTFGVMLVMNISGQLPPMPFGEGRNLSKDLIMATVVTGFGPIGVYLARERKRVDNVEARLPDFLNDLAETRRAGLTLTAALRSTALSDYGALTSEIKKMADQVAWGVSFPDALGQFAKRVPTNLIKRTVYLIIEASASGGSVTEILKAAARDAYELKALEEERRVTMTTYLIVLYVVFGVFMAVIGVLDSRFIPEVIAANEAAEAAGGQALGGGSVDRDTLNFVYYTAAIVQAVGNGLVAGVLTEGRVTAGFRHVAYMSALSWVVFRIFLAV